MDSKLGAPDLGVSLPNWAVLWLPLTLIPMELALRQWWPSTYANFYLSEHGIVENLTVVALLPAIYLGFALFQRRRQLPGTPPSWLPQPLRLRLPPIWLGLWFLLNGLGALYMAGEEISWGQHIWGWQTPDVISTLNDQNETNFHNISGGWFDQKPRALLTLWVMTAGIGLPIWLWTKRKTLSPNEWPYWVYPTTACLPVSIMTIIVVIPASVADLFGTSPPRPFDIRASETQELYFALFITIYLTSAYRRLRALAPN